MKKWRTCSLLAITILSIQNKVYAQEIELLKSTHLPFYPSASTLEYYNNRLYVIGDDAPQMLVLDKEHQLVDSLLLFKNKGKRIGKDQKPDLEASVLVAKNNKPCIVAFSSFSGPERNKVLMIYLPGPHQQKLHFKAANVQLPPIAVKELNIEGAAYVGDKLVFSNRANDTHKDNDLILLDYDAQKGIGKKTPMLIPIQLPDAGDVIGMSGLSYVKEKDILLFTASTENTDNAYSDGDIGASYVGYIYGFSKKLSSTSIKADGLLNLTTVLGETGPQKIEAIAVEDVQNDALIIHLAADNDNGESYLFKARLKL